MPFSYDWNQYFGPHSDERKYSINERKKARLQIQKFAKRERERAEWVNEQNINNSNNTHNEAANPCVSDRISRLMHSICIIHDNIIFQFKSMSGTMCWVYNAFIDIDQCNYKLRTKH